MTLIFLTVSLIVFILLDSFNIEFGIDSGWIDLLKSLLITVYVAYFGSRGAEKFKSIGNNK
jgi:ABC-type antimicrobial peptide transport system permease subunit